MLVHIVVFGMKISINWNFHLNRKRKYPTTLDVHHIDGNKWNSTSENLVTLCTSCHGVTKSNDSEWWITYFKSNPIVQDAYKMGNVLWG